MGHLCQLCAHGGIGPSGIEGIQWQTTYHGEGILCLKTLERHVLSLRNQLFSLPSNLANVVEDQFYHKWKMLTIELHYAWTFLNPNLLNEV